MNFISLTFVSPSGGSALYLEDSMETQRTLLLAVSYFFT